MFTNEKKMKNENTLMRLYNVCYSVLGRLNSTVNKICIFTYTFFIIF